MPNFPFLFISVSQSRLSETWIIKKEKPIDESANIPHKNPPENMSQREKNAFQKMYKNWKLTGAKTHRSWGNTTDAANKWREPCQPRLNQGPAGAEESKAWA